MSEDGHKIINTKLTLGQAQRVEKAAQDLGLTKREFMRQAVDMLANFDAETWRLLNSWADRLALPVALVISAMTLFRVAMIEAETEVLKDPGRVELPEFKITADGPLNPHHLLAILKADYLEELQRAMGKNHY